MSRAETITRLLRSLSSTTPDIEAAAVVDNDGLLIASALPTDVDDDAVAAMSAALLGISERIVAELGRGQFELIMVRGDTGYLILARTGPGAVLAVLAAKSAKLGLIFLDTARTGRQIAQELVV